jgi:arsenite/tail-anchored protein-transporting ATPase
LLSEIPLRKLIFVTGKGGVGKTTFVTALGIYLAGLDRRVLLAEVDNARPTIGGYFDRPIGFEPVRVGVNLDAVNIDFMGALRAFLYDVVPVSRLVRLILRNRLVRTFLVATPGAREMVLLGRVLQLARVSGLGEDAPGSRSPGQGWDHMIIDLPASGHAVSMLGTPITCRKLFRVGPIRNLAEDVIEAFTDDQDVAMVMVSISEEMSINETLETMERIHALGWPPLAGVVLNRFPTAEFGHDDAALLRGIGPATNAPGNTGVLLEAARAVTIERARSTEALQRLQRQAEGMVGRLPFVEGGPVEVARSLAEIMGPRLMGEDA